IRQYEDFFNATGMATPDDLEEFRSCQKTYQASSFPWNDMTRGLHQQVEGLNDKARELGLTSVLSSGAKTEDEGLYPIQHSYWENVMEAAVESEDAAANGDTKHVIDDRASAQATAEFAKARAAARLAAKGDAPAARRRRRTRG
ncbi:MAG: benzoate 1,2-dioxygenase large subunit, partial [Corynebacterium sp.]|nr:benzoate 1,2-dioxygenase large subunit [Corynebacterium sp.]